jgi:hypothetical protein
VIALAVTGGVLVGLLLGWCVATLTYRVRRADAIASRPEDLIKAMDQIVNMEAVAENRHLVRVRMQRSGHRSERFDAGEPAKVMRMRTRRRITINRDDRA